ncbi:MAG: ACT domain-containing protein, partial [Patescibacteria group bacterium]|nr:ACT domain-containing protein [Patescibacteria group bacterium]
GVMHNRAIEFAKRFNVPVHVRSSFSDNPGTMIATEVESPKQAVCGCAKVKEEARVTVLGVPDHPGVALAVFSKIAARNVAMDMIVQNVAADGLADISFTVFRDDLPTTLKAVEEAVAEVGAEGVSYDENVSKVSVVGLGMARQSGVAQGMFSALGDRGVNIQMISTSEIKISVLVSRETALDALRTVHEAFSLDKQPEPADGAESAAAAAVSERDAVEVAARMQRMEEMIIDDVTLDAAQARVTVLGVPDTPGLAAQVFDRIARASINVDMIVQSTEREGRSSITFTVPCKDLKSAVKVATDLSKEIGCPEPTYAPEVAKLSVFGIGLRSHTGVAYRVFQSLAKAKINIVMISTSEVRLNVVVDAADGEKALAALENEFADVRL